MEKIRTLRKKLAQDDDDIVLWNPNGNNESEQLILNELQQNEQLRIAILSAIHFSNEKKGTSWEEFDVLVKKHIGGAINCAFELTVNHKDKITKKKFFLKVNNYVQISENLLEGERYGLSLLELSVKEANQFFGEILFVVPKCYGSGKLVTKKDYHFLLMEFIQFGENSPDSDCKVGKNLAKFYKYFEEKGNKHRYGLDKPTFMGTLKLDNTWKDNWLIFFLENRLQPHLQRLKKTIEKRANKLKSMTYRTIRQEFSMSEEELLKLERRVLGMSELVLENLYLFFHMTVIKPALVHGDFTRGNYGVDIDGNIVFYDPVVYFGHRELDLAQSVLWGRLSISFYEGYYSILPRQLGWEHRQRIYNLYAYLHDWSMTKNYSYLLSCVDSLKELVEVIEEYQSKIAFRTSESKLSFALPVHKLKTPVDGRVNVVIAANGSFSPVHRNHILMLEMARNFLEQQFNLNVLGAYLTPTSDREVGRKLQGKHIPYKHRLEMLQLAADSTDFVMINRSTFVMEDMLSQVSYQVRSTLGIDRVLVMYLCGADVVQIINSLLSPDIFVLCVPRNSWDDQLKEYVKSSPKHKRQRLLVIEDSYEKTISSTKIRQLMRKLGDEEEDIMSVREELRELMDDRAVDYLIKNELYKFVV